MKHTLTHSLGILLLSISLQAFVLINKVSAQDEASVSLQVFYDNLSPYGQWMSDRQYGYVWVPDVGADFRPYATNGYWVMTAFGNTWVSTYPWGWAPFHYGRWIYDAYYGWIWIPGYEWGPAWVCWRHGGGYYGWAPLGPWFAVAITFGDYNCPSDWWIFIPHHQLYHRHPNYRRNNTTFINNTTVIVNTHVHNHVTHVTGPKVEEVHSITGNNVQLYSVIDAQNPGAVSVNGNSVHMFRPAINRGEAEHISVRPSSVIKAPREIGKPQSVRSTGKEHLGFRNERQPAKQSQPILEQRSTIPNRNPVMSRPSHQTKPVARPNARPAKQGENKPAIQPKPSPVQQRPVRKAGSETTPQQQKPRTGK